MPIVLKELTRAIVDCWESAEASTAKAIAEKYHNPAEENITFLFGGELRASVSLASQQCTFAAAFAADIRRSLSLSPRDSGALVLTEGLIGRVNLHGRHHEGRLSGCDLGILVCRPTVEDSFGSSQIRILRNQRRGLMAQAKLNARQGGRNGGVSWGSLTSKQKVFLPRHAEYSALLLYQLDREPRNKLAPFRWQPIRSGGIAEIQAWLRDGNFPDEMSSADMIRGLSEGQLGTGNESVLKSIIDPQSSWPNVIEIQLDWPDDQAPPESLWVEREVDREVQQHVMRRLS